MVSLSLTPLFLSLPSWYSSPYDQNHLSFLYDLDINIKWVLFLSSVFLSVSNCFQPILYIKPFSDKQFYNSYLPIHVLQLSYQILLQKLRLIFIFYQNSNANVLWILAANWEYYKLFPTCTFCLSPWWGPSLAVITKNLRVPKLLWLPWLLWLPQLLWLP